MSRHGPAILHWSLAAALVAAAGAAYLWLDAIPGADAALVVLPAIAAASVFAGRPGAGASLLMSGLAATGAVFAAPAEAPAFANGALILAAALLVTLLGVYARELIAAKRAEAASRQELLDEQNHRIKNNLTMVSALLSLQASASQEPAVRDQLLKAVQRVQTVADMHAQLYRGHVRDAVNLNDYLGELCAGFRKMIDTDRIELKCTIASVTVDANAALALGVIVVELLTNAAKYAYPPPERGTISVELKRIGAQLHLKVGDSGKGLPNDVEKKAGLGLRVVRSMVAQLNGELTILKSPGATFRISAPYVSPERPIDALPTRFASTRTMP